MLYVINILYYLIADLDLLLVISCYSKLCYGVKIVLSQDEYLLPTTSKPLIYLCFLRSYNYTRTTPFDTQSQFMRTSFIIAITARLSIIKFVKKKNSDKNGCCGAKCPRLHDHLIPSRLYDLLMQDSVFVWRNPLQPLESTGKGCSIVHADFFHNVLHAHIGKQHLLGIFYPDIHQIF